MILHRIDYAADGTMVPVDERLSRKDSYDDDKMTVEPGYYHRFVVSEATSGRARARFELFERTVMGVPGYRAVRAENIDSKDAWLGMRHIGVDVVYAIELPEHLRRPSTAAELEARGHRVRPAYHG